MPHQDYLQSENKKLKGFENKQNKIQNDFLNKRSFEGIFEEGVINNEHKKEVIDCKQESKIEKLNLIGYVKFENHQDGQCFHRLYLDFNEQKHNNFKITKCQNNSLLLHFEDSDEKKNKKNENQTKYKRKCSNFEILSEILIFLDNLEKYQNKQINFANISVIFDYFCDEDEKYLRNEIIKRFLLNFLKNKSLISDLEEINKYEYLLVLILLSKKKFKKWDTTKFDLKKIQQSKIIQNKNKLFLDFLRIILKYFYQMKKNSQTSKNKTTSPLLSNLNCIKEIDLKIILKNAELKEDEEKKIKFILSKLNLNDFFKKNITKKNIDLIYKDVKEFYYDYQIEQDVKKFLEFKNNFFSSFEGKKNLLLKFIIKVFMNKRIKYGLSYVEFDQAIENFKSFI